MSATVPLGSIVELIRTLVRTPSRGGVDPHEPVAAAMSQWLAEAGLAVRSLVDRSGRPLALYAEIGPAQARPWWVLDATLDTAGFGDEQAWRDPPTAAVVRDGWLFGRGSSDSKAGAALFAHLLAEFAPRAATLHGRLGLLLDLDEHTGGFGGAKAFFEGDGASPPNQPDGVMIGYPGETSVVAGGRGFLRARISLAGRAAHSGGVGERGLNAALRAAAMAQALAGTPLPLDPARAGGFPHPPQLTVTALRAGAEGQFSIVPDAATLDLDCRLVPGFDDADARRWIARQVAAQDANWPGAAPARIDWIAGWPPYRVADDHAMVRALQAAAAGEGWPLPVEVAGPSNIGNYLASRGVPALCGFGVRHRGLHATDECIELASIAPVYRIWRGALERLLALPAGQSAT